MSSCCGSEPKPDLKPELKHEHQSSSGAGHSCCAPPTDNKKSIDYLLWGSLAGVVALYFSYWLAGDWQGLPNWFRHLSHGVFELMNTMWWGVLVGIVFVGLLTFVPQSLVVGLLGRGGSLSGILRATAAGVLLDLCSHGILMVGMKLYQKGASLGQVMAFLIASPWNSLSLTLVLVALIGLPWTLAFIALSMIIAIIAGLIFDRLVATRRLAANPAMEAVEYESAEPVRQQLRTLAGSVSFAPASLYRVAEEGFKGSRMVLRWLLFGVLLAAMVRAFVSVEMFRDWFGPSLLGVLFTLLAATVIEVCSEGSTPIAADLLNRAKAPGNSFLFLMAGVATDYTEIMVIKDTMGSWKTALFLPLVVLPQVLAVALIINFWPG